MKITLKLLKTKTDRVRIEIYGEDGKLHNVSTSTLDELATCGREINLNLDFYTTTVAEAENFVDHCIEHQLKSL